MLGMFGREVCWCRPHPLLRPHFAKAQRPLGEERGKEGLRQEGGCGGWRCPEAGQAGTRPSTSGGRCVRVRVCVEKLISM